jgi:two-component system response regulator CpxR
MLEGGCISIFSKILNEFMSTKKRVLLIDRDIEYSKQLQKYLITEGFNVDVHNDEIQGLLTARNTRYEVILLDIVTSKIDGFELLKGLRESSICPIMVITTRDYHFDHVYSLEIGADDYLIKSIHQRVLRARLNVLIRRFDHEKIKINEAVLYVNHISLCQTTRKSYYNDEALDLTGGEFNILFYLMSNAGKIVSKESIAKNVLGQTLSYYNRCIDMHICNIRKKISLISSDAENAKIKTIRGAGYIFLLATSCDTYYQNKNTQLNSDVVV